MASAQPVHAHQKSQLLEGWQQLDQVPICLLGGQRKEWEFEAARASEVGECNSIMNVKGGLSS
jgi:hypothetical protein